MTSSKSCFLKSRYRSYIIFFCLRNYLHISFFLMNLSTPSLILFEPRPLPRNSELSITLVFITLFSLSNLIVPIFSSSLKSKLMQNIIIYIINRFLNSIKNILLIKNNFPINMFSIHYRASFLY